MVTGLVQEPANSMDERKGGREWEGDGHMRE